MGVATDAVRNIIIWGNHSSTQFPDVAHATVTTTSGTTGVYEAVKDDAWLKGDFITVCHVLCNCIMLSLSLSPNRLYKKEVLPLSKHVSYPQLCQLLKLPVIT